MTFVTERPIGYFLQQNLFQWFLEVFKAIMRNCKYLPKLASPPIRFEDPIYGTTDLKYIDFLIPAFLPTQHILLLLNSHRTIGGCLESKRCPSIITVIQSITLILIFFPIWGLECKGSIFAVILLMFLSGFCGLMYGEYSTRFLYIEKFTAEVQKLMKITLIVCVNVFLETRVIIIYHQKQE
ncbi:PREDICTED: uncharacterized protein LOC105565820 isoform X2 [Vollenhovia emeryi]|uniref:uncharacterized protein LOC105565820 isoform X2 n=1 Tax=Vollenhovia emeryi TaxID=411798 RepID=UPI0005F40D45|nr:PREDICTED: uncharacterized protein LOC105565820 isoform X2 [Vollenhovia emeryi]